jgi:hypothetical protein
MRISGFFKGDSTFTQPIVWVIRRLNATLGIPARCSFDPLALRRLGNASEVVRGFIARI